MNPGHLILIIPGLNIPESGKEGSDMVTVLWNGRMGQVIKASGFKAKLRGTESSSFQMENTILENGKMTRQTDGV